MCASVNRPAIWVALSGNTVLQENLLPVPLELVFNESQASQPKLFLWDRRRSMR